MGSAEKKIPVPGWTCIEMVKLVGDGEFHPCPNSNSSATKSEPSDEPPQLIKCCIFQPAFKYFFQPFSTFFVHFKPFLNNERKGLCEDKDKDYWRGATCCELSKSKHLTLGKQATRKSRLAYTIICTPCHNKLNIVQKNSTGWEWGWGVEFHFMSWGARRM